MKSKALPSFWKYYRALPQEIQDLAKQKYRLWLRHPFRASLQFKEVRPHVWSVRVSQKYRALAQESGDQIIWYWIGSHDDYDLRV